MSSSLFQRKKVKVDEDTINQAKEAMKGKTNPMMLMVNALLAKSGLSPEQLVRQKCSEMGIDVDEFMSQLK